VARDIGRIITLPNPCEWLEGDHSTAAAAALLLPSGCCWPACLPTLLTARLPACAQSPGVAAGGARGQAGRLPLLQCLERYGCPTYVEPRKICTVSPAGGAHSREAVPRGFQGQNPGARAAVGSQMPCAGNNHAVSKHAATRRLPTSLASALLPVACSTPTHLTAEAQGSSWTTTAVSTPRRRFGCLHGSMQCCELCGLDIHVSTCALPA
jgi:hypothetical protein